MPADSAKANDASYHLVESRGHMWPAVLCEEDMIPAEEVEVRPSGYYRGVLLLGILEFKWVLESELYEFDPSASQRVSEGPLQQKLQKAFDSVLGSPDGSGQPFYPDIGYWRSELLARDLDNDKTPSTSDTESISMLPTPPRIKKVTPPSVKDLKRPWAKFKFNNKFGEEFGYAKKKVKSGSKKSGHWFPDEDPNSADDKPPSGYFDKIKKEKTELKREDSDEDDMLDEGGGEEAEASDTDEDSGDEDPDDEEHKSNHKPRKLAQQRPKKKPSTCVSDLSKKHGSRSTSRLTSTSSKPVSSKTEGSNRNPEVTQLCKELDAARAECSWEQAEFAANHLVGLAPWSASDTILIAKVAFRVPARANVKYNFEHWLREAVADEFHRRYEYLREMFNGMMTVLFKDHEDLAEMVYERRLQSIREKRVEVIEISDSD